ncbi:MAG: glucose-6-phosphate dehydrogenase [Candidatus Dormibacteraeota bacterium]|nr:glucose-6-phosphate dehydrogenase [Candidatus Dormibacteraeota bacterium]
MRSVVIGPSKKAGQADIPIPPEHVIVLFGATGDLARRKLLPGLFQLSRVGLLPAGYRVIGSAPPDYAIGDEQFREVARKAAEEFGGGALDPDQWREFASRLSFAAADAEHPQALVEAVQRAEREIGGEVQRLYHLAVPPSAFTEMVGMLGASGLAERARVIIEKPFGHDLASAQALNAAVHKVFPESRVFRIDHFLGKESVDNILALRFANGMFEPVWNRSHIDHVQIDVPETLPVGSRGAFYEQTGAFRDMVVTHLFQVLGFVAMEPPTSLKAKPLITEKIKVFDAMRPVDPARVVRGQYDGYRSEPGVAPDSQVETFVALEVQVDSWRWSGVPFYLRTGKRLAESRQVITIAFKEPPRSMFDVEQDLDRNELIIDFADPGSITAHFLAKVPGPTMHLGHAHLTFRYGESFNSAMGLEAYQRLIYDAMIGDHTLFTTSDGIERLWELSTPLLENPAPVQPYEPGSWGPQAVHDLIAPRRWYLPEPQENHAAGHSPGHPPG